MKALAALRGQPRFLRDTLQKLDEAEDACDGDGLRPGNFQAVVQGDVGVGGLDLFRDEFLAWRRLQSTLQKSLNFLNHPQTLGMRGKPLWHADMQYSLRAFVRPCSRRQEDETKMNKKSCFALSSALWHLLCYEQSSTPNSTCMFFFFFACSGLPVCKKEVRW